MVRQHKLLSDPLGEVVEWFMALVLKTSVDASSPSVRIRPSPLLNTASQVNDWAFLCLHPGVVLHSPWRHPRYRTIKSVAKIWGNGPAFLPSKQVVDLQNWQLSRACKRSKDRYWRTTGTAKAFRYRNLRWNGDELKLKNKIFLKERGNWSEKAEGLFVVVRIEHCLKIWFKFWCSYR